MDRSPDPSLGEEQLRGLTDMPVAEFRAAAHQVADLMADYLETIETHAVFPSIEPGSLRPLFPATPPEAPEPLAAILDDYRRLVEPNATHWQHPGFLAYFATTASGPGILGEMLTASLGQNPMLWRTSPIGTELEEVVVDWLRQALGLPETFGGLLTDTASTSSLIALAGARQAAGVDAAAAGLAGRPDLPALRVYASTEAHSSIEKACMTLGLGRDSLVRVAADERYAMRPDLLAAAIAADRAAGRQPIAIVATVGTTSSTAIDPVAAIADIAEREGLWLHVEFGIRRRRRVAARAAGAVRRLGARRIRSSSTRTSGCSRRSMRRSCSRAGCRSCATRSASCPNTCARWIARPPCTTTTSTRRSSVVAFVRSSCGSSSAGSGWRGCAAGSRGTWSSPRPSRAGWTRIRTGNAWRPCRSPRSASGGDRRGAPWLEDELDTANAAIMDAVNRTGEVFLSHTRLDDRFTIRIAIGNLRTEPRHVERAWTLLREAAADR